MNIEILESCLDADGNELRVGDYIELAAGATDKFDRVVMTIFHRDDTDFVFYTIDAFSLPWEVAQGAGLRKVPPPDTWDKLLEDLERFETSKEQRPYHYLGRCPDSCTGCQWAKDPRPCYELNVLDIARRIRELRGGEA